MADTITRNPPFDEIKHLLTNRQHRRRKMTEDETDIRESLRALADDERTSIDELRKELGLD